MHVEKIIEVRDTIMNLPPKVEFNMKDYKATTECGTAYCIAGLAQLLNPELNIHAAFYAGKEALGLNYDQAHRLFLPDPDIVGCYVDITAEQAVATLNHLIETGEVQWQI